MNDLGEYDLKREAETRLLKILLEHQSLLLSLPHLLGGSGVFWGTGSLGLRDGGILYISLSRIRVDFVHFDNKADV